MPSLRLMCVCVNAIFGENGNLSLINLFDTLEIETDTPENRRARFYAVFVFQKCPPNKSYQGVLRLYGPSDNILVQRPAILNCGHDGQGGMVFKMDFEFPTVGQYKFEIELDPKAKTTWDFGLAVQLKKKVEQSLPFEEVTA